jgi:hypothetical protein
VDVKHCNLLSWFSKDESHEQDGERLPATRALRDIVEQHPAILPWPSNLSSVRPDDSPPGMPGRHAAAEL